jgi:hypothetical protein
MDNFWQAVTEHDWSAPQRSIEFRVYYDDHGDIICYSMEDLPGQYIVTDQHTFNQVRMDFKVRDGKLIKITQAASWKMTSSDTGEYACHPLDVAVIVPADYPQQKFWKVETTNEES